MEKMLKVREDYFEAFGVYGPEPFGVPEEELLLVLRAAIEKGKPVPDDYDWYPELIHTDTQQDAV